MHSSRMCIVRSSSRLLAGGVSQGGVSVWGCLPERHCPAGALTTPLPIALVWHQYIQNRMSFTILDLHECKKYPQKTAVL